MTTLEIILSVYIVISQVCFVFLITSPSIIGTKYWVLSWVFFPFGFVADIIITAKRNGKGIFKRKPKL